MFVPAKHGGTLGRQRQVDRVLGQPGIHSETLSQKKKKKVYTTHTKVVTMCDDGLVNYLNCGNHFTMYKCMDNESIIPKYI
jgi:hypothetical protein